MIKGSCHCGAVTFTYHGAPEKLVSCNCSICRRLATLWAHGPEGVVEVNAPEGSLRRYAWGDKGIDFCACATCNCTTHWEAREKSEARPMALNFNLAEPADIANLRIRRFDGADSWKFLD